MAHGLSVPVPLRNRAKSQAVCGTRAHLSTVLTREHNDESTVNIALSEREHLVNGFKRDRSTPSKEQRAKEPNIERTRAFSQRTLRLRSAFTQCHLDCTLVNTSRLRRLRKRVRIVLCLYHFIASRYCPRRLRQDRAQTVVIRSFVSITRRASRMALVPLRNVDKSETTCTIPQNHQSPLEFSLPSTSSPLRCRSFCYPP